MKGAHPRCILGLDSFFPHKNTACMDVPPFLYCEPPGKQRKSIEHYGVEEEVCIVHRGDSDGSAGGGDSHGQVLVGDGGNPVENPKEGCEGDRLVAVVLLCFL